MVKADEKAAVELERLYYEAKNVERKKRKHREVTIGVIIVSGTEIPSVSSQIREKKSLTNRRNRRRTRN